MEKYTIQHPYLNDELKGGFLEIEIASDNLIYGELKTNNYGVQCINPKNHDLISKKCRKVANLIREIDKLNK